MTNSASETSIRLLKNLDEIALDLIKFYGLRFNSQVTELANPLHRWMDFRLRYIEPEPKKVYASKKFSVRLPAAVKYGLKILSRKFNEGIDINGYQSKGLIKFNDVSANNRGKRTDLLWADWGIHHLHITDLPILEGEFFSERKCSDGENWLLFCVFSHAAVLFIDIKKHNEDGLFEDQDLLEIIYENWPQYLDRFELKGIKSSGRTNGFSSADIKQLRVAGLTTMAQIDGKSFMPAGGITNASTSGEVIQKIMALRWWIRQLAEFIDDPNSSINTEAKKKGATEPHFVLSITPLGLILVEVTKNIGFYFSNKSEDQFSIQSKQYQELMLPSWAMKEISRINFKKPIPQA